MVMFHHFILFSSSGHSSFIHLIYGSKDSSLQELSNEILRGSILGVTGQILMSWGQVLSDHHLTVGL